MVHVQLDHAPFVEQGHHGSSSTAWRMVYLWMKPPNFAAVRFLALEQRRAGEADVAGVGKDPAHLGVDGAVLAAVAFVDQAQRR